MTPQPDTRPIHYLTGAGWTLCRADPKTCRVTMMKPRVTCKTCLRSMNNGGKHGHR